MKTLPFNKYSWLTTHNSFAKLGDKSATGALILAPTNQQDSITEQLNVCRSFLILIFFNFVQIIFVCVFFLGKNNDISRPKKTMIFTFLFLFFFVW